MPAQHRVAAEPEDDDDAQRDQQLGGGHDARPFAHHGHAGVVEVAVAAVEAGVFVIFAGKGAHHRRADDVFLHAGGKFAQVLVDAVKEPAHLAAKAGRDPHQRNHGQQRQPGQHGLGADHQHHRPRGQQSQLQQFHQTVAREALQRADVFGGAADQLAGLRLVVVGKVEVLDVVVKAVPQVVGDVLRQPFAGVTAHKGQGGLPQADAEDEQGGLAEVSAVAAGQAAVNHIPQNVGDDQPRRGNADQREEGYQHLPPVRAQVVS